MFDSAVGDCIVVPLTGPTYPAAVAVRVCHVAAYLLFRSKWNPELDADDRVVKDYEAAVAWWDGLCGSDETLPGTTPVDPGTGGGALIAIGDDPRGW
jgi:phage gp36-like protein